MFEEFLQGTYWNNTGKEYLIALAIFVGSFIVFRLFNYSIIHSLKRFAKKSKTTWDDIVVDFLDGIHWNFFFFLSIYIASTFLVLPELLGKILYYAMLILTGFYIAKGLSQIVQHFVEKQVRKRQGFEENKSMMKVFATISKIIIWSLVLLMVLSNLGIEITPLIASLGIGGLAIAFAFQAVLEDLFSAFVIYFDKPFKEGDFIIIGKDMGTIKHIGIKSTRIETLQGQELVVSNKELTTTRVNNYKKMDKRRINFNIGVTYSTSSKKLEKAKEIITDVITKINNADLDRVHFKEFGDFSLIYEVVYYVKSADYNEYMDTQEKINMEIYKRFEKEGIEFAFPTQTIHLEK